MSASDPCGSPSYKNLYRAAAVFFWLVPAFRAPAPLEAALSAALGACLWWVAQRQTSPEAALLAAGFYAALPSAAPAAPLGVFAMLYTAQGVAHALQGPRRKWPPRIGLMAAAALFTAAVDVRACAAALALACPLSLWLAERRRGVLLGCFAFWTALAAACSLALRGFPLVKPQSGPGQFPGLPGLAYAGPFALALGMSAAFYAAHRRSRFYGHTAPLLLALLLSALDLRLAEPFALLFLAGLAADMLRGPRAQLWRASLWLLLALECAFSVADAGQRPAASPHASGANSRRTSYSFPASKKLQEQFPMADYRVHSIEIDGMHCDECVRRISAALAKVPGVRVHRVEIGKAEVMAEPAVHSKIHAAIQDAGYTLPKLNATS